MPIVLKIKTSYRWASPADLEILRASAGPAAKQRMAYDVMTKSDDWIVAHGRKRGQFSISTRLGDNGGIDENELKVKLSLAPLRTGKLFLPSISVNPLPSGAAEQSYNMASLPTCEVNNVSAGISLDVLESLDEVGYDELSQGLGRMSFWIDRETGDSGVLAI